MSDYDLKNPDTYASWIEETIRYSDLDPNNHVNNGGINAYFEDGRVRMRTERLSKVGADTLAGFVLVKYTVEYHAQLSYPGTVRVGTATTRIGTKSYTLGQAVFDGERCIATAEVVTVCMDPASGRSAVISDDIRTALGEIRAKVRQPQC